MTRASRGSKQMKAMNKDVWLLRESVVKITQMLTGKGLRVTQQGLTARVDVDRNGKPISVNLPYIPDNATPELCQAVQGFLDKEVSSVLFTEFAPLKKLERNKELHAMAKRVEDTRVEREMGRRFRGSASNLANTSQFFLDKYTTPKLEEAVSGADEEAGQQILLHPLIRMLAGFHVETDYMSDKMSIVEETYNKIKSIAPRLQACSSTAESIEIAREIRRLMEEEDPEGEGEGEGEGESEGEGEGEGESGGSSSGKGKSKGENDGEGEEGDEEGMRGGDSDEIDSQDSPADDSELDKENANDYNKELSKLITGDVSESAKHAEYLVYTRDNDVVETMKVGKAFRQSMFSDDIEKTVEHMVGPLQKDLERAIAARSLSQWENGRRSGKLHGANLARLATNDARVFRRKHESRSKDVAVSLVIDMSGSMSGNKIMIATQAAYALSSVLERMRITHEVIGFTTGQRCAQGHILNAEEKRMGRRFTRNESLYMPVIKHYQERLGSDVKQRFGWTPNVNYMRNNVDGESVEIAARRLLSRPESGKIMMVLSDGYPAADGDTGRLNDHLRAVVAECEAAGINTVGIGINSDSVQNFYPKHVVLRNVNDLPKTVISQLRALLLK